MSRVFSNDRGSIHGRIIPKTQIMVLDAVLLNSQHYKVRIKGKVEQSREGVAPSSTPYSSNSCNERVRVTTFLFILFGKVLNCSVSLGSGVIVRRGSLTLTRKGYDTRSILKPSLPGLNSEFSFS